MSDRLVDSSRYIGVHCDDVKRVIHTLTYFLFMEKKVSNKKEKGPAEFLDVTDGISFYSSRPIFEVTDRQPNG